MNQATRIFIDEHTNDDVALLSLQAARFPDVDMPFAIRQISGKQKVRESEERDKNEGKGRNGSLTRRSEEPSSCRVICQGKAISAGFWT